MFDVGEYLAVLVFFAVALFLSCALAIIPRFFAVVRPDSEKLSAYECGFESTSSARKHFDIRFYLVAILFIIFDLEIAFLFPWAVSLHKIGADGFWSMVIFLGIVTVGFVYEWSRGALEWE